MQELPESQNKTSPHFAAFGNKSLIGGHPEFAAQDVNRIGGRPTRWPLFTGTSTVGNSVITQSNGNVGIGTTAPRAQLDIEGSGLMLLGGNFFVNSNVVAANSFQRFSMGYGAYWNNADGNYTISDPTYNQQRLDVATAAPLGAAGALREAEGGAFQVD